MTQVAAYDNVPVFTGEIATQENNGFFQPVKPEASNALAASDQTRAIAEVQAALVIAQANPRNELRARDRLMQSCSRIGLAQSALYDYPRGKEQVIGPSIRLAEAAARAWGNMTYGFREVARRQGESECEAFAWDLETNTKAIRQFSVRHRRDTKQGGYDLKEERDIYEMVANYAQRRVRATIQEIIPGDIMEDAVAECQRTLAANVGDVKAATANMLRMFEPLGITKAHIEQRLGNRLDVVQPGQVMKLWRIYNSIKDGIAGPGDWFDVATTDPKPENRAAQETIAKKTQSGTGSGNTPPKNVDVQAKPASSAQGKAATAKQGQAQSASNVKQALQMPDHHPSLDDLPPNVLTVPCPKKEGRHVDELDCLRCSMREGCPSWKD